MSVFKLFRMFIFSTYALFLLHLLSSLLVALFIYFFSSSLFYIQPSRFSFFSLFLPLCIFFQIQRNGYKGDIWMWRLGDLLIPGQRRYMELGFLCDSYPAVESTRDDQKRKPPKMQEVCNRNRQPRCHGYRSSLGVTEKLGRRLDSG